MKEPYLHDVVQVVKLGNHYQLKYLQYLKDGGFEERINFHKNDFLIPIRHLSSKDKNKNKLSNNISRAITTCRNIALSNNWDYFATLTIDPAKYDRFNIREYKKNLSKFIKSINRKYNCKINYLLIPELHSNGAWHAHGLFSNIPNHLVTTNSNGFLDFLPYSAAFGFCSMDFIRDKYAVSFYITKHLSKQLHNSSINKFDHLYIASHGLSRGNVVKVIPAAKLPDNFHFQYESLDGSYKSSFFEDDTFIKQLNLL